MRRFDVSMPLFEGMPAFPGDPPFESRSHRSIQSGDAYNVSRLGLGSHTGTHVDPPRHFIAGAPGADRLDLEALNGPCYVVPVDPSRSIVGPADLTGIPPDATRVLLRTANSARWARGLTFFSDYVALRLEAAQLLLDRGVRLVGIDALSIESDPTGTFPVHHRVLGSGALILEGLLLANVPPGAYELTCLPLKIRDGDGAPARAVLRAP